MSHVDILLDFGCFFYLKFFLVRKVDLVPGPNVLKCKRTGAGTKFIL